jgi:hypothetical protein
LIYRQPIDTSWPLGIFDPLGIIDEFITSLDTLWNHPEHIDWNSYSHFLFSGLGILQGWRSNTAKSETLLAYCGECGYSPLIYGQVPTCKQCGKLICSKCYFCSSECPNCLDRKQREAQLSEQRKDSSI